MIKELEEEKEETQDPEVEFAIAGAVRECGGLEIILSMIQVLQLFFPLFFLTKSKKKGTYP
jgi:E3 ubiquitin-protein ligase UBR4